LHTANDVPASIALTDQQLRDAGAELARAREGRGLSLAELSSRTKVRIAALSAIEAGQLERLPGGIYTRAFLRAYANEVGCDEEATLRRFGLKAERTECFVPAAGDTLTLGLTRSVDTHSVETHVNVTEIDAFDRRRGLINAWTAVTFLVLVVVYIGFARESKKADSEQKVESRAAAAVTAPAAAAPVIAAPAAALADGSSPPPQVLRAPATPAVDHHEENGPGSASPHVRVDVQPLGPCWIAATADGQQVARRLLDRGQNVQIEARDAVVLRIGDAEACSVHINGIATRRLGTSGQPVTLQITPANYRAFVES
jgi:cytoskeletal protein RodZ